MIKSDNLQTVGDYVSLVRGKTYQGALVGEPGPALLGLGSIQPGGGFSQDGFKSYGGDCPPNIMLEPGDLYASLKGATKDGEMIGSVARVPHHVPSGRLTQDTVKLVIRPHVLDRKSFLYWTLRTPQYRKYCANRATGSAVVALSRRDFLSYPVPLLTRERQVLVRLLDTIESKLELNRLMNQAFRAIAELLFERWIVNSNCAEWAVAPLDEIAQFLNGAACQKYAPRLSEPTLPVVKIRELRQGLSKQSASVTKSIPAKWHIRDGDILFSWSGTLVVAVWTGGEAALNQHLFKVTSKRYPKWFYYHWILRHLKWFQRVAADKATTMGHIKRHHLSETMCLVPPADTLASIDKVMRPLFERQVVAELENRTLAALRDTLLPKLISGELHIPDAERLVSEVA